MIHDIATTFFDMLLTELVMELVIWLVVGLVLRLTELVLIRISVYCSGLFNSQAKQKSHENKAGEKKASKNLVNVISQVQAGMHAPPPSNISYSEFCHSNIKPRWLESEIPKIHAAVLRRAHYLPEKEKQKLLEAWSKFSTICGTPCVLQYFFTSSSNYEPLKLFDERVGEILECC